MDEVREDLSSLFLENLQNFGLIYPHGQTATTLLLR